jgi:hypothetical protein
MQVRVGSLSDPDDVAGGLWAVDLILLLLPACRWYLRPAAAALSSHRHCTLLNQGWPISLNTCYFTAARNTPRKMSTGASGWVAGKTWPPGGTACDSWVAGRQRLSGCAQHRRPKVALFSRTAGAVLHGPTFSVAASFGRGSCHLAADSPSIQHASTSKPCLPAPPPICLSLQQVCE